MKRLCPMLFIALAATTPAGCGGDQLARGTYEGAKLRNDALKSTPGASGGESKGYDEYEAERQRILQKNRDPN